MKTTLLILLIILVSFSNFVFAKTINGKPRIIDGDTIHIKSNKIRLHGMMLLKQSKLVKLIMKNGIVESSLQKN